MRRADQRIKLTLPPEIQAVVFFWRGLIGVCSYSFWRWSNSFLMLWLEVHVERLQFLIQAELLLLYFCSFSRVVCHVHTLLVGGNFQHGIFSVSHTTHTTHHTPHTTTHHNNTTTTPHGDRHRERQRQGEKRRRKRRDKTRQERRENREDSFSVWWCMAVLS